MERIIKSFLLLTTLTLSFVTLAYDSLQTNIKVGSSSDISLVGDFDGDGRDEIQWFSVGVS